MSSKSSQSRSRRQHASHKGEGRRRGARREQHDRACQLDANMVRSALPEVPLAEIDLLVIENVGNLVCPAEFAVGEDRRVMVSSVTEGEDKPLKYPLMFRTCEL